MFAIADDRRRAGTKPKAVPREVPVLFHLHDVSPRQNPLPKPPQHIETLAQSLPLAPPAASAESQYAAPQAEAVAAPLSCPLPVPEDAAVSPHTVATAHPLPESTGVPLSFTPPSPALAETPAFAVPMPAEPPARSTLPAVEHSPLDSEISVEIAVEPQTSIADASPSATDTSPPAKAAADTAQSSENVVTPRTRPASQRTRKTPASEDWFATHGKFIALGFGLALVATIYFARAAKHPTPSNLAHQAPLAPLADEPAVIIPQQTAVHSARAESPSSAALDSNAAKIVEAAASSSESKAALEPPVTPQLASQSATNETPADKDRLFEFTAKKADDRLATRPDSSNRPADAPQNTAPPLNAAPPLATVPPLAPPLNRPDQGPAYPMTSSPQPIYPVAPTAANGYIPAQTQPIANPAAPPYMPSAYAAAPPPGMPPASAPPAMNYRSPYPTEPAPPAQGATSWNAAPSGATGPASYQPPYNTASGRRYEPTGSGNY